MHALTHLERAHTIIAYFDDADFKNSSMEHLVTKMERERRMNGNRAAKVSISFRQPSPESQRKRPTPTLPAIILFGRDNPRGTWTLRQTKDATRPHLQSEEDLWGPPTIITPSAQLPGYWEERRPYQQRK